MIMITFNSPVSGSYSIEDNIGNLKIISNNLHVFDGESWRIVETDTTYDFYDVLIWAREKMFEEQNEKILEKQFPALSKAKENYKTIKRLVQSQGEEK